MGYPWQNWAGLSPDEREVVVYTTKPLGAGMKSSEHPNILVLKILKVLLIFPNERESM